ncbi:MAG: HPr family phosphocarrier protein [Candidatus Actinomarina sp.]|jgi:phosphocarrier protein HPr|nr:HPr family phosphocarrier protein [Candidatus Actinomarina sp.]MBL6836983.1 HPr family phosphocarrier protein [Candidatus Actinomarina sp.]
MLEKELVVKDEVGLHARPASLFVKIAQEFDGTVKVKFNKKNPQTGEEELIEKDGKSMIGILSLGIAKDKPFTIVLDGEDEELFLSKFEELLDNE